MINIKELKLNKDKYLVGFKNKGLELTESVEEVIKLHDEYSVLLNEEQEVRMNLNQTSDLIKNDPQNTSVKEKAKELSNKAKEIKEKLTELDNKIQEKASYFPNITNEDVPVGENEDNNVIISEHLNELKENKHTKPHWEIIEDNNYVLNNESSLISGARQVIYNNKAALVIKALERLMLDNAMEQGFKIIEPPVIVNKEALYNTAQLPKFEEDLYKLTNDQYLISTAEIPLTNLVANKLLNENELPMNFVAATNCFRKESGSAGKDTRGIIRLHQFRKVELVTIGKPENEKEDFNKILNTAINVLEKLKLPYRLLQLCTGDTSFGSKNTIDIEVWMPGVDTYREISSVSMMGDFQARRMKARYKKESGEKQLVNTYNGSGLAIGRTFAAIVENYIQENGKVKVPEALKQYLPFDEF